MKKEIYDFFYRMFYLNNATIKTAHSVSSLITEIMYQSRMNWYTCIINDEDLSTEVDMKNGEVKSFKVLLMDHTTKRFSNLEFQIIKGSDDKFYLIHISCFNESDFKLEVDVENGEPGELIKIN